MICLRCITDHIIGKIHPPEFICWTGFCKNANIKICVVCFKDLSGNRELCDGCVYNTEIIITK